MKAQKAISEVNCKINPGMKKLESLLQAVSASSAPRGRDNERTNERASFSFKEDISRQPRLTLLFINNLSNAQFRLSSNKHIKDERNIK